MVVPDVGVLIKIDRILTTSKGVKTKVPIIIGCNVFKHAARKFIQDYGETALELFECPKEIDPLFFSCVELYYFSEHDRETTAPSSEEGEANGKRGVGAAHMASSQVGGESAIGTNSAQGKSGRESKSNFPTKKKCKNHSGDLGGFAGRVTVEDKYNPMCIPANSSKTIIGKVPRVDRKLTYLVKKTEDSNLPIGVRVNNTLVTPSKSRLVSVILMNNNNHNVWIRQPLYMADLWEVEPKEWEYEPVLTTMLQSISFKFHLKNSARISFPMPQRQRKIILQVKQKTKIVREKRNPSLVHLRTTTHWTLISKGSANNFRSR